ncbi:hypothetical protein [Pseudoalteromonas luteoviolacea]|uniref:Uncharacterized protein n=1 Tax=Pseudoalteromonas luteoviolacea (strain 2ta16) TaxID=1353533 RepID=V4HU98_PSEL2|nr:hypothetical protein [Pseudoalteromonas luteoviolacea]ESP91494.1 hypothetical protein PL2TA16_00293 [Pseudoalteromonas luteoviolacea 2ta16]KZN40145.1 hypothetical protein N483_18320 [Pseudoalteromonas luteoviolacea NCIMB 1944]
MRYFLALLTLLSNMSLACTVESRSYTELVSQAKQVFIGSVVEIHWSDFEKHVRKHSPVEKEEVIMLKGGGYTYRAIPHKVWKGQLNASLRLRGGYCNGAFVDGGETYLIMTFDDSSELGSKTFPLNPELIKIVKAELSSN